LPPQVPDSAATSPFPAAGGKLGTVLFEQGGHVGMKCRQVRTRRVTQKVALCYRHDQHEQVAQVQQQPYQAAQPQETQTMSWQQQRRQLRPGRAAGIVQQAGKMWGAK
jgi:hypothetical protein